MKSFLRMKKIKPKRNRQLENFQFRHLQQAYERHCHPFNESFSPRWFRSAARQLQCSCFNKK